MKQAFRKQLWTTVIVVLLFNVMNTLFQHWIFSSIGHGIAGLIWIVHPVKMNDAQPEKQQLVACRITGVILILLGILLRAKLY